MSVRGGKERGGEDCFRREHVNLTRLEEGLMTCSSEAEKDNGEGDRFESLANNRRQEGERNRGWIGT